MINNIFKIIAFLSIFLSLASCAVQEKNNWIVAEGKHGQTWIDGVLVMETTYKSAQECLNNVNYELNNNAQVRRQFLIEKRLSLICAENGFTKDIFKFDDAGFISATGGLPYEGFIRFATSTEKYSAWFPGKKVCEVISSELKLQNKNQDLVCP